ncbi:MAG: tellurium resistance protein [Pseudomonadota bacterium]
MTISILQDGGDCRNLVVFLLCDGSKSMHGAKIGALNMAMDELSARILEYAKDNPHLRILVQVVVFSGDGATTAFQKWVSPQEFRWTPLTANGGTPMGAAFDVARQELENLPKSATYLQPTIVLVSDGQPTDDWEVPLGRLHACPMGKDSQMFAVAIGDANRDILGKFCAGSEIGVLEASNASKLVDHIVDKSIALADAAVTGRSFTTGSNPSQSIDLGDLPEGSINESFIDNSQYENDLF